MSTTVRMMDNRLDSFLRIVSVLSVVFMVEALALMTVTGKPSVFMAIQILVYFFCVLLTVIFFRAFKGARDNVFVFNCFAVALIIRFVAVLGLYFLFWKLQGGPFLCGWAKDDHTYHMIALSFAKHPELGLNQSHILGLSRRYALYPYLVSFLYRFVYPHTLVARLANAIIGSAVAVPLYYFVRNLGLTRNAARLSVSFYVFSPTFVYYSSLQLKDMLLVFLCSVLFYLASALLKTESVTKIVLIAVMYFAINTCLLFLRTQMFFLFAFFYLIFLLHCPVLCKKDLLYLPKLLLAVIVGALVCKYLLPFALGGLKTLRPAFVLTQFTRYYEWHLTSVLGKFTPIIVSGIGFFLPMPTLVHLPFAGASYPLDIIRVPLTMEVFFSSFISVAVILRGKEIRNRRVWILVALIVSLYAGLIVSNLIASPRHRMLLTFLTLILVSYGMELRMNFGKILLACFVGSLLVFFFNLLRCVGYGIM